MWGVNTLLEAVAVGAMIGYLVILVDASRTRRRRRWMSYGRRFSERKPTSAGLAYAIGAVVTLAAVAAWHWSVLA